MNGYVGLTKFLHAPLLGACLLGVHLSPAPFSLHGYQSPGISGLPSPSSDASAASAMSTSRPYAPRASVAVTRPLSLSIFANLGAFVRRVLVSLCPRVSVQVMGPARGEGDELKDIVHSAESSPWPPPLRSPQPRASA